MQQGTHGNADIKRVLALTKRFGEYHNAKPRPSQTQLVRGVSQRTQEQVSVINSTASIKMIGGVCAAECGGGERRTSLHRVPATETLIAPLKQ